MCIYIYIYNMVNFAKQPSFISASSPNMMQRVLPKSRPFVSFLEVEEDLSWGHSTCILVHVVCVLCRVQIQGPEFTTAPNPQP